MYLDSQGNITLGYLQGPRIEDIIREPRGEESYVLFIRHFDKIFVVMVFDVIQEAGPTKCEGILSQQSWVEGFPQR